MTYSVHVRHFGDTQGEMTESRQSKASKLKSPNSFKPSKSHNPNSPKGHDALLKKMIHAKAEILIVFMNGDTRMGVLKDSDRFTITVETTQELVIIYKHSVAHFSFPNFVSKGSVKNG